MKTPTIFFGSSNYVFPIIEMLHNNYDLKLVVTTEKEDGAVPSFCKKQSIPFISVITLNNESLYNQLAAFHCEFAVLADFKLLVKKNIIDLFPKGILNIHPSLLPQYRGATPGTSAILHGDHKTGVSIMLLDTELDHGSLLGQAEEPISTSDTSASLYSRLFVKGTNLLESVLPNYLAGTIQPREQDHSQATYSLQHLSRESGFIDLNKLPATNYQPLDRMVRAYYPWPGVWFVMSVKGKGVRVKLLPEEKIQVEGKKPMTYKDFINGYEEGKEILEKLGLLH